MVVCKRPLDVDSRIKVDVESWMKTPQSKMHRMAGVTTQLSVATLKSLFCYATADAATWYADDGYYGTCGSIEYHCIRSLIISKLKVTNFTNSIDL